MLTLIRGQELITEISSPIIQDGALLVRDGRIEAVGRYADLQGAAEAEVLDLRPRTLLPGLMDCHVHLVAGAKPGTFYAIEHESDEWLLLRAVANAREALAAGITTVRDTGGRHTVVISLAKAIATGMLVGPRVVASGAPITTTGGHCWWLDLEADGVVGVQQAVRRMHKAGADFIKVMVTGGGITAGSNVRRSQYNLAELQAIVEEAHRLEKRVGGHVHGMEGIRLAVEAGFDTLEHCSWVALAGPNRDYRPEVVEQMLRQGTYVCRTMAGFENAWLEEATPENRFWPDYQVFRNMVRDGVRIIAGTDAGIDNSPFYGLIRTMETMVGLGQMPVPAVLDSATRVAAEALNIADQVGTLTPGKRADLIAVAGSPLQDIRVLRKAEVVLRDGRVVARDGKVIG